MNIRTLTEVTIVAALAMVLSLIPTDIGWYQVSLGTLPVAVLAVRRGTVAGLTSGFLWGLLHVLFKVYILSPIQFVIEY
ncbi:energy-coupled thiamine transporter ThiT, partial [Rhizobium sp. KAs_5_22]